MSNRTQEENETIILSALRSAGEKGLSLEEIRDVLFGKDNQSKSLAKKMLERLKTKGYVQVKMGRSGPYYAIPNGR